MCMRTMSYYQGFRIAAWKEINYIQSFFPIEFLDTEIFENEYLLLRKYIFGKRVPYHTGHRRDEMYIRKNNFVSFFTVFQANFGRSFDLENGEGDFFSYNVSGIVNLPNAILLADIL
jgi:hypothetical protein